MYNIQYTEDGHVHFEEEGYYDNYPTERIVGKQVYSYTHKSIKTVKSAEWIEDEGMYRITYTDDTIGMNSDLAPIVLTTDESLGLPVIVKLKAYKLTKEYDELLEWDMRGDTIDWDVFNEKVRNIINKQQNA